MKRKMGLEIISSDLHLPKSSTLPHLLLGGEDLYVHMSTIWPIINTQSVHITTEVSGGTAKTEQLSPNNIPE